MKTFDELTEDLFRGATDFIKRNFATCLSYASGFVFDVSHREVWNKFYKSIYNQGDSHHKTLPFIELAAANYGFRMTDITKSVNGTPRGVIEQLKQSTRSADVRYIVIVIYGKPRKDGSEQSHAMGIKAGQEKDIAPKTTAGAREVFQVLQFERS